MSDANAKDWARLIVWGHMKMRAGAVDASRLGSSERSDRFILMFAAFRAASRIRGSDALEQALPGMWERAAP